MSEDFQIDEFDKEFYERNQGVIKSQKYFRNKFEEVQRVNDQLEKDYRYTVNMTYNNKLKMINEGLNANKRGRPNQEIVFENNSELFTKVKSNSL